MGDDQTDGALTLGQLRKQFGVALIAFKALGPGKLWVILTIAGLIALPLYGVFRAITDWPDGLVVFGGVVAGYTLWLLMVWYVTDDWPGGVSE